jgi:hypothetical protein
MRSLIIIEVEHGETTDDLDDIASVVNLHLAAKAMREHRPMQRSKVTNYTVRVDLPACFVLDSGNTDNEE